MFAKSYQCQCSWENKIKNQKVMRLKYTNKLLTNNHTE